MTARILSSGRLKLRNGRIALATLAAATPADPPPVDPPPPVEPGEPAAGTVSVAPERAARWVYQRVGTSKAVPVSGASTAPAGTVIEARAVDATTLEAVQPWAAVGTVDANGAYAGTLSVPQGKWYRRQVRIANATTGFATETNTFGIGIYIAQIGQSNMVGLKNNGYQQPLGDPAAYEYKSDGVLQRVGNINDKIAPNTLFANGGYSTYSYGGTKSDGYVFVANLVAQQTGLPVVVINMAVIGSQISSWHPKAAGATKDTNWDIFAKALASIGGDCEFALWLQGESNSGTAPATYRASLNLLPGQFHAMTGRNPSTFKFGVVSLGPVSITSSYSGGNETNFGRMRALQVDFANTTPGVFFAASAHDFAFAATGDGVHMGGQVQTHLGRRYAKSILAQLGIGTSAAGPRIASAVLDGATLRCTVAHTGGTSLRDGTGSTAGTALGGFQLWDGGGVEVPVTGSAITGDSTFELYLASAPAGPCTLSYAGRNAPHCVDYNDGTSGIVAASILLDNAEYYRTRNDSTLGCPMQAFANFTVTT